MTTTHRFRLAAWIAAGLLLLAVGAPWAQTLFSNNLIIQGGNAGIDPSISAFGTDTNINVNLVPKGTGCVKISGTCIGPGSAGSFTSLTVTPGPTSLSGAVTIQPGASTPNENLGGAVLFNSATDFTPAGTGEETAYTYDLPANALNADAQFLHIKWTVTTAANANTKRARLYFGATVLCDTTAAAFNNMRLTADVLVWRTGAATQKAVCVGTQSTEVSWATAAGGGTNFSTPAEALAGAVTIKLTLLNATAAADSTARAINILWYPAGQ